LLQSLEAGSDAELSESVHVAGSLSVDIIGGIKSLDFTCNLSLHGLGIKESDIVYTGLTSDKGFPGTINI